MSDMPGEIDLLRAYLRDRDLECPACGHNLRGAAGLACPECGARLCLGITSLDLPHRCWLACVLAFALPLGLFGALAAAGTWSLAHGWMESRDAIMLATCWLVTIASIVSLVWVARRRTQFVQQSMGRQRWRAVRSTFIMGALWLGLGYLMTRGPYEWPWTLFEATPMP